MDRRSWPWKKKSSDKHEKEATPAGSIDTSLSSNSSQRDRDIQKKPNYVQISVESYNHLTGLEDQVKSSEEQIQQHEEEIRDLNEQLASALSDINAKEELVKQHAKVAEEAVSGWEKAEAEALALKSHLESVTLSKLSAEDRATHLDGALKECMRQIRALKEDHDQKLQDLAFTKNKQFDSMRQELEAKIAGLDQDILRAAAENAAISRSLQDRSTMLIKISEEKSQAETQIELLRSNIESCEKEISSLKYELHIASKELEIRTEEKNMSMKSAEVSNKQHTEGVKKIAKLEAECQRLRGLVRKKLPGPAALAQMKLEVESLGRDHGETRQRRSSGRSSGPNLSAGPEYLLDSGQKFHKETEFLTERILAMEEETKMLKEALANRNCELIASRNLCAKTESRLQYLEAQLENESVLRCSPKSIPLVTCENFSGLNGTHAPSITSPSEDGNEDNRSSASWTTLNSVRPNVEHLSKTENVKHLELMDDFLEMEKLARSNERGALPGVVERPDTEQLAIDSSEVDKSITDNGNHIHHLTLADIRSKILSLLESASHNGDDVKILENVKRLVLDAFNAKQPNSSSSCDETGHQCPEVNMPETQSQSKQPSGTRGEIDEQLMVSIRKIHEFVLFLGKEAMACDGSGFTQKMEEFSMTVNSVLTGDTNLRDFVFGLSLVLAKASELRFNVLGYKGGEADNSPDCIDKVALPENKTVPKDDSLGEGYENGCVQISSPTSNPEIPDYGNLATRYGSGPVSRTVSLMEFEELKSEKDSMTTDLARYSENLEMTKLRLGETEQLLAEVRSQLASAVKSNSLSETQLKCMVESYRTLETRAVELDAEVNHLRAKALTLDEELQKEKKNHQDTLIRCKELEERLQTTKSSTSNDTDLKAKQDRELTAAAEKLAECQETILMLGKQLKSLHPPHQFHGFSVTDNLQNGDVFFNEEPVCSEPKQNSEQSETSLVTIPIASRASESPSESCNGVHSQEVDISSSPMRSPVNFKNSNYGSPHSGSSSSSNTTTPEKHSRGFSRFFSSKGKTGS